MHWPMAEACASSRSAAESWRIRFSHRMHCGSSGFGVWLDLKPEIAYPRILRRGLPPFLAGSADPEAEFRRICREREPKFRAFAELPFGIETEEPAETVAERLASAIEKEYSK